MTSDDRDPTTVTEPDEPASRSSSVPGEKPKKKHLPVWQETILLLGIALVLAIVIKALFVQAFYIPSESMEPGLVKNDRILVEKMSYWFGGTPQRGDVVVFKDPGGWLDSEESAGPTNGVAKLLSAVGLYPSGGHLVKRVIGVAGDTIKCCDDQGRLMVNGKAIDGSTFVKRGGASCDGPMVDQCADDWKVGPIPEGHVFVMGDINPYLPSKISDYRGSGTPIWSIVEPGSVLSTLTTAYRSTLGDAEGALRVIREIIAAGPQHDAPAT